MQFLLAVRVSQVDGFLELVDQTITATTTAR